MPSEATTEILVDPDIRKLEKKRKERLTTEEKRKLRAHYLDRLKHLEQLQAKLKADNPFWYYSPVTGDVGEDRWSFLREFLKPEDVPQKLHGAIDVHLSEAPIRGASGGNQSSKTTLCCIEAFIKATGAVPYCFDPSATAHFKWNLPAKRTSRNGPQFVRVIGEDFQNGILRNLVPTYRKWAPKEYLIEGSWDKSYSAGEQTIRLIDPKTKELTGTIEFMSNKQELGTFAGPARHKLIFDEEPHSDVYKENLMRMTTSDDFDVLFGMTPDDGMSWTADLAQKGKDGSGNKVEWFQIPSVCNPHANMNVLREILSEMTTYDEVKMRLLGEFVSLSGLVYGRLFDPRVHVIDPFDTHCTCGQKVHHDDCPYSKYLGFLGIDAHLVKPSCATLCFIDREDNFYVDTCYQRSVDTDEFKADLHRLVENHRIDWSVFDPSNDSSLTIHRDKNIFYEMTHGINRVPRARKGNKYHGSIAAGVDAIRRRLKFDDTGVPKFFIFRRPENELLIRSMRTLQRDVWANEDVKGQRDRIQEGVHDHHAAMRYILQFPLRWKSPTYQEPALMLTDEEALVA